MVTTLNGIAKKPNAPHNRYLPQPFPTFDHSAPLEGYRPELDNRFEGNSGVRQTGRPAGHLERANRLGGCRAQVGSSEATTSSPDWTIAGQRGSAPAHVCWKSFPKNGRCRTELPRFCQRPARHATRSVFFSPSNPSIRCNPASPTPDRRALIDCLTAIMIEQPFSACLS